MIGPSYQHTGLSLRYGYAGNGVNGWSASAGFVDYGFLSDNTADKAISTEGELRTRYMVADGNGVSGARAAVEVLLADLKRMGIKDEIPTAHSIFVSNREDEELGRDSLEIPESEKAIIREIAAELGYSTLGI